MQTELQIKHHLPDGFLTCKATDLYKIVPFPTVFHLDWDNGHIYNDRLFISILLHGDEVSGLHAVQSLLSRAGYVPERAISLFVGNVDAAKHQVRRLEEQIDFNRCWPGGDYVDSAEGRLMQDLIDEMKHFDLMASIDIHNNTGINPHYGCINKKTSQFHHLASLFSQQIVYFKKPTGVQSMSFAKLCPAVTLECGTIGDKEGVIHAADYLQAVLKLDCLHAEQDKKQSVELLHTTSQITLEPNTSFSFDGRDADIMFINNFEHRNFQLLRIGFAVANIKDISRIPLKVKNELGEDAAFEFFSINNNQLVLKQNVIPSMITSSQQAVRQDCLGYFMEIISL